MKLSLKLPVRFSPRKPRTAVAIDATLLLPDDVAVPISIRNISTDGFMGTTVAELAADTLIGVALPGCGIVPARVRWNGDGEIGAQFRRPLDLERLQQACADTASGQPLFQARLREGPF